MLSLKSLPFTSENFDTQDTFEYTFYDNTFTRDFGPFKSGDKVDMIDLELDSGILKTHGTENLTPIIFSIDLRCIDWKGGHCK